MALETNHVTYLQLIDMFNTFADDHYQINLFDNGVIGQLTETIDAGTWERRNYPIFYVTDGDPLVTFDKGMMVFNFVITLAGIEFDKDGRELLRNQTMSNLIYIYQDFLAYLQVEPKVKGGEVEIFWDGTSDGTSFEERFDDNLLGVSFNLSIKQKLIYDLCAVPKA